MIFSNVRKELPGAQRLRGQNHANASPKKYRNKSNNARNIDRESVSVRKFLAADVESIESICAVGAVFVPINHQSLTSNFSLLLCNRWFRGGWGW